MNSFLVVVQEAPGERTQLLYVVAHDADAALAKVPIVAKDFFGTVPKTMKTWRITRNPVMWSFFECSWGEQAGEILLGIESVPSDVRATLLRFAGIEDGLNAAFDTDRMLVDTFGGAKQFGKEFNGGGDIDRESYARGWQSGLEDGLTAKLNTMKISKGGSA